MLTSLFDAYKTIRKKKLYELAGEYMDLLVNFTLRVCVCVCVCFCVLTL